MRFTCPRCSHTEDIGASPPSCPSCGTALAGLLTSATALYDPEATSAFAGDRALEGAAREIGGYRLLRRLGAGGMGTVHEAEQIATGRRVAVKLIRPELAGSPEAVARFRREGRLASTVTHPRCVFLLTADEDNGRPFIAMELMPGATLRDLVVSEGPLPPAVAVAKALDVIEGLEALHRRGIIHRDIKPGNCFLEDNGRVKVGDFGLALSLLANGDATRGKFAGTPLFASPEQHRGEPLDARTDVYSVSATLYYLLTGRVPFQAGAGEGLLDRIAAGPAPSLRTHRPDVPAALDKIVLQGLERSPARRWKGLPELKMALLRFGPARLSSGGVWLRVTAYLIDHLALVALLAAVGYPLLLLFRLWWPELSFTVIPTPKVDICSGTVTYNTGNPLLLVTPELLYFTLFEGLYGCGLGKWLLRLRVVRLGTDQPPDIARALMRSSLFLMLLYLPRYLLGLFTLSCLAGCLLSLFAWWNLGAVLLLLSTMRERNGYRALHDFVCGTCVLRFTWPGRDTGKSWQRKPGPDLLAEGLRQLPDLPASVGPFAVRAALAWWWEGGVLLGEDVALGRKVFLWLRPAGEPPLPPAWCNVNRLTRLRWLTDGAEAWRWDAFVAEGGCPLPDLVARRGPLTWDETRVLLLRKHRP
jgi:hypothetical protein